MPDTTAYNLSRTGTISSLFFKNLWVLFSAIFVVSLIGTLFTTYLFMKSTAVESTRFLADDLTSQLNTVYSLLEGMSEQPLIKDTSIPVQERAASMKTYADAFGFWMIGVVDPDGTISSTLRPKTGKVQRGYIFWKTGNQRSVPRRGHRGHDLQPVYAHQERRQGRQHLFRHHAPFPAQ